MNPCYRAVRAVGQVSLIKQLFSYFSMENQHRAQSHILEISRREIMFLIGQPLL